MREEPNSCPAATCNFLIFTHTSSLASAQRYIRYHAEGLCNVLAKDKHRGILVLYVAPAELWKDMVQLVDDSHSAWRHRPDTLLAAEIRAEAESEARRLTQVRMELEKMQSQCAELACEVEEGWPLLRDLHRIRIMSPLDFSGILDNIRSRMARDFRHWFQKTSYDVPKLIDSILRLRFLGANMACFRFDEDVLFNQATLQDGMAQIKGAVNLAVESYWEYRDNIHLQAWLFSCQYAHPGLTDKNGHDRSRYRPWSQAFSTRCMPALLATPALCHRAQFEQDEWMPSEEDLDSAVDQEVMMQFYGLQERDRCLVNAAPSAAADAVRRCDEDISALGIAYLGANPLRACISGAALCTSQAIALDCPPCCHFQHNVMWIDDHCLSLMAQKDNGSYLPKSCHLAGGHVVKARSIPANCAWYTLEKYLPALLFGTIVDKWINEHDDAHLLKFLQSDLHDSNVRTRQWQLMRGEPCGPLARNMRKVVERGFMLEKHEVRDFRSELWHLALERIKDVYWQWGRLSQSVRVSGRSEKTEPTFASLWATGTVSEHPCLASFCEEGGQRHDLKRSLRLGSGLVSKAWHDRAKGRRRSRLPELRQTDLNHHMIEALTGLVDDSVAHLEWMLLWPSVVQAVRSVSNGRLRSDMTARL